MAVAAAAALSCHTPSQRAAAQHSRARPFGSLSNGFISSDRMNRNRRGAGRCRPAMKIPVPEIEEMYLKEHLGVDLLPDEALDKLFAERNMTSIGIWMEMN
uniref:Uncharacterized protein n=1 Tax=Oryza rufipogon TaxID=4529 RepID=A0A0E0NBU2_ORYRU